MEESFDLTFTEYELRILDYALYSYIRAQCFDRFDIILSEIEEFKKHFDKIIDLRLSIRSCFDKELSDNLTDIYV